MQDFFAGLLFGVIFGVGLFAIFIQAAVERWKARATPLELAREASDMLAKVKPVTQTETLALFRAREALDRLAELSNTTTTQRRIA